MTSRKKKKKEWRYLFTEYFLWQAKSTRPFPSSLSHCWRFRSLKVFLFFCFLHKFEQKVKRKHAGFVALEVLW